MGASATQFYASSPYLNPKYCVHQSKNTSYNAKPEVYNNGGTHFSRTEKNISRTLSAKMDWGFFFLATNMVIGICIDLSQATT